MEVKQIRQIDFVFGMVFHHIMLNKSGPFDYRWNQITFLNCDPTVGSYVLIDGIPLPGGAPQPAGAAIPVAGYERRYECKTNQVNKSKLNIDFTNSPVPYLYVVWNEFE